MLGKNLKKFKFHSRQTQRFVVNACFVPLGINLKRPDSQRIRKSVAALAPDDSTNSSDELSRREGLSYIVVGPRF